MTHAARKKQYITCSLPFVCRQLAASTPVWHKRTSSGMRSGSRCTAVYEGGGTGGKCASSGTCMCMCCATAFNGSSSTTSVVLLSGKCCRRPVANVAALRSYSGDSAHVQHTRNPTAAAGSGCFTPSPSMIAAESDASAAASQRWAYLRLAGASTLLPCHARGKPHTRTVSPLSMRKYAAAAAVAAAAVRVDQLEQCAG